MCAIKKLFVRSITLWKEFEMNRFNSCCSDLISKFFKNKILMTSSVWLFLQNYVKISTNIKRPSNQMFLRISSISVPQSNLSYSQINQINSFPTISFHFLMNVSHSQNYRLHTTIYENSNLFPPIIQNHPLTIMKQ